MKVEFEALGTVPLNELRSSWVMVVHLIVDWVAACQQRVKGKLSQDDTP